MSTTAVAPKTKRDAQRFTQKDIPKLIAAYSKNNDFNDAYALYPSFDPKTVKNKLVKLGIAESSRPQLNSTQKETVNDMVQTLVLGLVGEFGEPGVNGEPGSIEPLFIRGAINAMREYLPVKAAAEEAAA